MGYFGRQAKEIMRGSAKYQMAMLSIKLHILWWLIVESITQHFSDSLPAEADRRRKAWVKTDVELEARPERLFFSDEELEEMEKRGY